MLGASKAGLEVLAVPGTMQAIFHFYQMWHPSQKDNPLAKARVRQALSLAIDRNAVITHVMAGKARLPMPFATFSYTTDISADRWKTWADENYRYDPALAKKILAEEGYPNGFTMNFANVALPGTQYMINIGTTIVDMWSKIGVKVTTKHYEWGAFPPLERGDQAQLAGWASMFRTAGRPDAPWRYNVSFSPTSNHRFLGDKDHCTGQCDTFAKTYQALLDEREPKKRTELADAMVAIASNSWLAVPIIEGMGYYAVNAKKVGKFQAIPGRHELGDVFERVPHPDKAPWN
jgi:peptide/nickel transport system substrate-binding protein